jgi:hypothetical protein
MGSDILAIPPLNINYSFIYNYYSCFISAGILSKAMTQHAPAASAILACSAFTTSIITPPYKNLGNDSFILYKSWKILSGVLFIRMVSL